METRALGTGGLRVSAIGLGVMGMSEFYGKPDEAENEATLARAVELGVTSGTPPTRTAAATTRR